MMQGNAARQEPTATVRSADEMLDEVYRDLVQIHMAIASRTSSDKEVVPWVERELKTVVNDLGAFRRARRETAEAE